MSPLGVLSRGYAIASDEEGNVIRSAAELTWGQRILLRLSSGSAKCSVEQLSKGEENG
jgi:exodeoxyribonuclease VII large subunit